MCYCIMRGKLVQRGFLISVLDVKFQIVSSWRIVSEKRKKLSACLKARRFIISWWLGATTTRKKVFLDQQDSGNRFLLSKNKVLAPKLYNVLYSDVGTRERCARLWEEQAHAWKCTATVNNNNLSMTAQSIVWNNLIVIFDALLLA